MIFIIVICVVFIILCLMSGLCACLRIAGMEDDIITKQFDEERSIESADIFIEDIGVEEDEDTKIIARIFDEEDRCVMERDITNEELPKNEN